MKPIKAWILFDNNLCPVKIYPAAVRESHLKYVHRNSLEDGYLLVKCNVSGSTHEPR